MIKYFIKKHKNHCFFLTIMFLFLTLSNVVLASSGIVEFASPFEKIMNFLARPIAKAVSIVGMPICVIYFIINKEDISGSFKSLLRIVFGICLIIFAAPIVNTFLALVGQVYK